MMDRMPGMDTMMGAMGLLGLLALIVLILDAAAAVKYLFFDNQKDR